MVGHQSGAETKPGADVRGCGSAAGATTAMDRSTLTQPPTWGWVSGPMSPTPNQCIAFWEGRVTPNHGLGGPEATSPTPNHGLGVGKAPSQTPNPGLGIGNFSRIFLESGRSSLFGKGAGL